MKGLTERQKEILDYIRAFRDEYGRSPTLKETGDKLGITPAAVHYAYRALAAKGAIDLEEGSPRGVMLTGSDRARRENLPIPLYPQEPTPEELDEAPGEELFIQRSEANGNLFAFRVTSYSMNGGGILPGDIAVIRRTDTAKDGAIVLASAFRESEGKLELRRYRKMKEYEELWPDNDSMGIIRSQKVAIYGILYEIRRSY